MEKSLFETVAYICIEDRRLLQVKTKKYKGLYMPGGKREKGEDDITALVREIKEEISVDLIPETIQYYGSFVAQAYAKPEGVRVRLICYTGEYKGVLKPSTEIERIQFFTHDKYMAEEENAPGCRLIFADLKLKNLID